MRALLSPHAPQGPPHTGVTSAGAALGLPKGFRGSPATPKLFAPPRGRHHSPSFESSAELRQVGSKIHWIS